MTTSDAGGGEAAGNLPHTKIRRRRAHVEVAPQVAALEGRLPPTQAARFRTSCNRAQTPSATPATNAAALGGVVGPDGRRLSTPSTSR